MEVQERETRTNTSSTPALLKTDHGMQTEARHCLYRALTALNMLLSVLICLLQACQTSVSILHICEIAKDFTVAPLQRDGLSAEAIGVPRVSFSAVRVDET